jgi:hypothetical protein
MDRALGRQIANQPTPRNAGARHFHRDGIRPHAIEFHALSGSLFARNMAVAHTSLTIVPAAFMLNRSEVQKLL